MNGYHLLAVCSVKEKGKSYVRAIIEGLEAYSGFLQSAPSVVIGDFNSNPCFSTTPSHTALVTQLKSAFGLVSAYHVDAHRSGRTDESPTYFQKRLEVIKPFHIDYCFIPKGWSERLGEVSVGKYSERMDSDHTPLLVEVAVETT